jgi:hypothetical protein
VRPAQQRFGQSEEARLLVTDCDVCEGLGGWFRNLQLSGSRETGDLAREGCEHRAAH